MIWTMKPWPKRTSEQLSAAAKEQHERQRYFDSLGREVEDHDWIKFREMMRGK